MVSPEELSPERIEETTTLILGAPYLGKSWHLERELGDALGVSITRDLPAGQPEDARLDVSVAAVADAIHRSDRATGMGGEIHHSVTNAAGRLDSEEPELLERFAEPVDERLEEEHDKLLAALEWRTALGLD